MSHNQWINVGISTVHIHDNDHYVSHTALIHLFYSVPGPTFQGSPLTESEPLQATVCFSQTEEDAVCILSGSTEQQRGRRQLRVTLILYTHWHLHLSLRGAVGRVRRKNTVNTLSQESLKYQELDLHCHFYNSCLTQEEVAFQRQRCKEKWNIIPWSICGKSGGTSVLFCVCARLHEEPQHWPKMSKHSDKM